jgi:hypothetical protein
MAMLGHAKIYERQPSRHIVGRVLDAARADAIRGRKIVPKPSSRRVPPQNAGGLEFALDSLLKQRRFELPVPLGTKSVFPAEQAKSRASSISRGP